MAQFSCILAVTVLLMLGQVVSFLTILSRPDVDPQCHLSSLCQCKAKHTGVTNTGLCQPRSQGPLSTSRTYRYPGYGSSRAC